MPDIEKVMDALEHCSDRTQKRCNPTCPYHERDFCENELASDVLALLKEKKEKDTVKPRKVKGYNPPMYTIFEYECENCNSVMMNKQPFCMGCGRRVIWDA